MALVLVKTAALSLGLNYGVHYASARLYDLYCIPHSWEGILQSMISVASPACSMMLNVMTATQTNYATIITATVTAALSRGV